MKLAVAVAVEVGEIQVCVSSDKSVNRQNYSGVTKRRDVWNTQWNTSAWFWTNCKKESLNLLIDWASWVTVVVFLVDLHEVSVVCPDVSKVASRFVSIDVNDRKVLKTVKPFELFCFAKELLQL